MKLKYLSLFFTACLLYFISSLHANIIEIKHFNELQTYLKPDTLIMLDVDNTLMEAVQELGQDQWFRYRLDTYISSGINKADALENALAEWEAVQFLTKVKVVEEGTSK